MPQDRPPSDDPKKSGEIIAGIERLGIPPWCGNCAYNLIGLSRESACPECGSVGDQETIVVFGWAGKSRHNAATMPPNQLKGLVISNSILLLFFALLYLSSHAYLMFIIMFTAMFMPIVYLLIKRWNLQQDTPGLVQARFGPNGFGQRLGAGPLKLLPWSSRHRFLVESAGSGKVRIHIRDKRRIAWLPRSVDIVVESHNHAGEWRAIILALRSRTIETGSLSSHFIA